MVAVDDYKTAQGTGRGLVGSVHQRQCQSVGQVYRDIRTLSQGLGTANGSVDKSICRK